jgi:hypothetical protein
MLSFEPEVAIKDFSDNLGGACVGDCDSSYTCFIVINWIEKAEVRCHSLLQSGSWTGGAGLPAKKRSPTSLCLEYVPDLAY